ncbi:major facilitator superfamily protein [Apiospora marii]|uniref:Major facilitator superfamily protein n=1 Tax=Apiospora marii TaxID=335849 RepID=A0ABR1RIQ8_9PEZI
MTSMAVASLLAGLDATAVSTAMPSMIHDLGTSQGYPWIANAYLLTSTAFTPLFGQTADLFGRRALTVAVLVVFAARSAIAAPAPTLGVLVLGCAVQGVGCGGLNALVEMVVCDLVPLRERGRFMGFVFAVYAVSTTVGPLVGGALATYATWRWIFYLNLPLAGLTLAMVLLSLGALPQGSGVSTSSLRRVDWAGNCLLPEPTTPLRLFANRTSLVGFWCAFVHNMLVYWLLFVPPVYFQAVLGASAFRSGVDILPTAAVCMPFTILSGGVMSKVGRYRPLLVLGFAFFPIAIGLFTRLDEETSTGYWAGIQIIGALAIGIVTPVTLPTILTPLPESDVAIGTATWAFMRGFGTIWGAAIPLAVFNSHANSLVDVRLAGHDHARALLANGGAYTLAAGGSLYSALGCLGEDDAGLEGVVKSIYVDSLRLCWQVGLAFALVGFLLTFVVEEVPMRTELETEFGIAGGQDKPRGGDDVHAGAI